MIWKKNIYDSLVNCSALCNEYATEWSNLDNSRQHNRSVMILFDCADVCRTLATSYLRGAKNAAVSARNCIDVCKKCAQEVKQINSAHSRQVYAMCQQAIYSCNTLVEMGYQTEGIAKRPSSTHVTMFYDIDLKSSGIVK